MEVTTRKRPSPGDRRSPLNSRHRTIAVAVATAMVAAAFLSFGLQKYRQGVDANGRSLTVLVASQ